MRKIALVAIWTISALNKCPAKPRFVQRRHRVLRLPVLIFVVYEIALQFLSLIAHSSLRTYSDAVGAEAKRMEGDALLSFVLVVSRANKRAQLVLTVTEEAALAVLACAELPGATELRLVERVHLRVRRLCAHLRIYHWRAREDRVRHEDELLCALASQIQVLEKVVRINLLLSVR